MPLPPADPPRVLIVEDEPAIRRFLAMGLDALGYTVDEAATAGQALRQAKEKPPQAVILDLGLPDLDGMEVIRRLREWLPVPIVVLSVRSDEAGKIAALDQGADDYVTKPFSMGELMARLRVAMRHRPPGEPPAPVFESGGLRVDLAARDITVDGAAVRLTPKEYDLLRVLVTRAGRIVTHRHLVAELWPESSGTELQKLRVLVAQLRRKLERDPAVPRYIVAEPGVGYRLDVGAG